MNVVWVHFWWRSTESLRNVSGEWCQQSHYQALKSTHPWTAQLKIKTSFPFSWRTFWQENLLTLFQSAMLYEEFMAGMCFNWPYFYSYAYAKIIFKFLVLLFLFHPVSSFSTTDMWSINDDRETLSKRPESNQKKGFLVSQIFQKMGNNSSASTFSPPYSTPAADWYLPASPTAPSLQLLPEHATNRGSSPHLEHAVLGRHTSTLVLPGVTGESVSETNGPLGKMIRESVFTTTTNLPVYGILSSGTEVLAMTTFSASSRAPWVACHTPSCYSTSLKTSTTSKATHQNLPLIFQWRPTGLPQPRLRWWVRPSCHLPAVSCTPQLLVMAGTASQAGNIRWVYFWNLLFFFLSLVSPMQISEPVMVVQAIAFLSVF